jgi:riboflavin synthase
VNLERALQLGGRLGGHLVSGHIDGRGTLVERIEVGTSWRLTFTTGPSLCALMVPKGSVAIDGVSLTLNDLAGDRLTVNVIPHTRAQTTLLSRTVGEAVNVEVDQLAKLVRRMLAPYLESDPSQPPGDISLDLLARSGFIKTPSGGPGGAGRR